jgi:MurNAc alpha-1-phosphate uridylyltransferase
MRPLTDTVPKPLLKVRGRPIIEWTIERLARGGIVELVINHSHLGALIEAALGDGARFGVSIRYSAEGEALETAGGIANALPLLGPGPFIAVNGDIVCDLDFATLRARELGGDLAHLVLAANPAHHPQGDFQLRDGRIQDGDGPRWTFAGIGLYRPELFASIRAGENAKLAPLLRDAMERGLVGGEIHGGTWLDVGTPERLQAANLKAESGGRKRPSPSG